MILRKLNGMMKKTITALLVAAMLGGTALSSMAATGVAGPSDSLIRDIEGGSDNSDQKEGETSKDTGSIKVSAGASGLEKDALTENTDSTKMSENLQGG